MSFDKSGLESYNDVAARIVEFRSKHPEGSLQPSNLDEPFRVVDIGERTFVVVVAAAYRTPDDPRPGIGMAYEPFPGTTPYTRGSELQNAETSAWGRAIVAALAADTRAGVASRDEIRNRQGEREYDPNNPAAIKRQAREEVEQARQAVIGKATAAIEAAETTEALDVVAKRITEVTDKGLITPNDAVSLRQKLVAKREVIAGMSEQENPK
jgi:ribosomal protein S20